jgi:hypothetical protein
VLGLRTAATASFSHSSAVRQSLIYPQQHVNKEWWYERSYQVGKLGDCHFHTSEYKDGDEHEHCRLLMALNRINQSIWQPPPNAKRGHSIEPAIIDHLASVDGYFLTAINASPSMTYGPMDCEPERIKWRTNDKQGGWGGGNGAKQIKQVS